MVEPGLVSTSTMVSCLPLFTPLFTDVSRHVDPFPLCLAQQPPPLPPASIRSAGGRLTRPHAEAEAADLPVTRLPR